MECPDSTTAPDHRGRQAEGMNPPAGYIRTYHDTEPTAKSRRRQQGGPWPAS
jgi:hypothetical protein